MNTPLYEISNLELFIAFIPVLPILFILYKWQLKVRNSLYALSRMLIQLSIVGYFLAYIFKADNALIVVGIITTMFILSGWIALHSIEKQRHILYKYAFLAIACSSSLILLLITQGVLGLNPWYQPAFMIPLASMILANAMTSVSLAAERMNAETIRGADYKIARTIAFEASLIPILNALFAAGLVSLPGMMTGQILSGVSPLIAARYQIIVMCMIFSSAGMSAAIFLSLSKNYYSSLPQPPLKTS